MDPWYKVVTPRKEVREGRSFNPDEFAIALEQVVAGTAPDDYKKPEQFFARTWFTRALTDHTGMVLRRLAGRTDNTAPVLTLITQFGGGKTHTLTGLYHLARSGSAADHYAGIPELLDVAGLSSVPKAKVAVFVGNAWDPQPGRETPWLDLANQLAGAAGREALGASAKDTAPGTEAIGRVFQAAGGPVLVLFDEVLNFMNRHRGMADGFYAFLQNLTVAMTGTTHGAAVISLPRSQVEMTDWDLQWQERVTKIVRRVAKDLIANDEKEISEVVRRRLFEDLGKETTRRNVARAYANWCFERRAQLPPEWTAVDTATTEAKAREYLRSRFEACYPFHPATLSVFQRKWQTLPQYQQTRGTLAMLAQWVSKAAIGGFRAARLEPLITLGSAPLEVPEFRAAVLGQLGEPRLATAIENDIAGEFSHAHALDADTKGPLQDIHRRVGAAILFECSGGQVEKVAHRPELRFALGEPGLDTTSIDNAAAALEDKGFYARKAGSDGFLIGHQPTLRKVVNDRKASLDYDADIKPAIRALVQREFERGRTISMVTFPTDGTSIPDAPKLTLVVADPELEWQGSGPLREQIAGWTKQRGTASRLYPASLVWCLKKPGRDLREKVELLLAWRRVSKEIREGSLGEVADRSEVDVKAKDAEGAAKDEVWGGYRFVLVFAEAAVLVDFDPSVLAQLDIPLNDHLRYDADRKLLVLLQPLSTQEKETLRNKLPISKETLEALLKQADSGIFKDGLREIDLGAGHASSAETLSGRVVAALKSQGLLSESVGAGYIERNWPPALKQWGAWPLASLRQCFLNGTLTRLLDPDTVLKQKVVEFVGQGDFGLASGSRSDGTYSRVWFNEPLPPDEVTFDVDVYLLTKAAVQVTKSTSQPAPTQPSDGAEPEGGTSKQPEPQPTTSTPPTATISRTLSLSGTVPPEVWNRLGTRLIPKLRSGTALTVRVAFDVTVDAAHLSSTKAELQQVLEDLGLSNQVTVKETP
jgi:hypothetical protein